MYMNTQSSILTKAPFISAAMALVLISNNIHAGTLTINTDPPLDGSPPNQYVAISRYTAANEGITVKGTATPQDGGKVVKWKWVFQYGRPHVSFQEKPGMVSFRPIAYGQSCSCTLAVKHIDSDDPDNVVCSRVNKPDATFLINIVKPKVVFHTSGHFAPKNAAEQRAVEVFGPDAGIMQHALEWTFPDDPMHPELNDAYLKIGCPYEYLYTITSPDNSGAKRGKIGILEHVDGVELFYKDGVLSNRVPDEPQGDGVYCLPQGPTNETNYFSSPDVTAPANPKGHAWDAPGDVEPIEQDAMKTGHYNLCIRHIKLTAYPLLGDSQNPVYPQNPLNPLNQNQNHYDKSLKEEHIFILKCRSAKRDGSGPYDWSVSY